MVGTEASFMERLEAAAAALRARLEGVKLRDLARCDAAVAAVLEAEVAAAEAAKKAVGGSAVLQSVGAEATGGGVGEAR
jgi:hypothetical protein